MAGEKAEAEGVHRSDLKRESASFVPNVVTLTTTFCHTFVLIKRECSLLNHTSVHLHFITTGKMLETPGVSQMASLSVQSFLLFPWSVKLYVTCTASTSTLRSFMSKDFQV